MNDLEDVKIDEGIDENIELFVQKSGLKYEDLCKDLRAKVPAVPLYEVDTKTIYEQTAGLSPDVIPKELYSIRDSLVRIKGQISENKNMLMQTIDFRHAYTYSAIARFEKSIYNMYALMCGQLDLHKKEDIQYYLNGILEKIKKYQLRNHENIDKACADIALRETDIVSAIEKLQNSNAINRRIHARAYVQAVHSYFRQQADIEFYTVLGDVLISFEKQVEKFSSEHLEHYEDIWEHFCKKCDYKKTCSNYIDYMRKYDAESRLLDYKEYNCYGDMVLNEELPDEGCLLVSVGELNFKKCDDGITIDESPLLGSGFVDWFSVYLNVPFSINSIPVTEAYKTIYPFNDKPIGIEGKNLKRVHLTIKDERITEDTFDVIVANCCPQIEELYIICDKKISLKIENAYTIKKLHIDSPSVYLKKLECNPEIVICTGDVYPHEYYGWEGPEPCTSVFKGLNKLKELDCRLKGKYPWVFENCVSLKNVNLVNDSDIFENHSFSNCESLEDIYIPDTVKNLGMYTFENCKGLCSVHIPEQIEILPKGIFKGCKALKKCYIPDNVAIIDESAFEGCVSLSNPWMPKNLQKIGKRAFYGCQGMKEIFIPTSVTDIGEDAFGYCPNLLIRCEKDSFAHSYLEQYNLKYVLN